MKTIEYVKKYNLSQTDKFSHKHFILDFGNDFISRLEVYRTFSTYSLTKFFALIDEMENKWNQINKKTAGNLPENVWDDIYYDIMLPTIDTEFPHVYEFKQKIDKSNLSQLNEMLMYELYPEMTKGYLSRIQEHHIGMAEFEWDHKYTDNSIGEFGLKPNYYYNLLETEINKKDSYTLYYLFDEFTYQLKKDAAEKAAVQFKIFIKERKKREQIFDWFDYVYSQGIKVNKNEYVYYFSTLNLTITAKEEEVKKNYRLLSMSKHPDKGGNKEDFVELTEAKNKCLEYLILSK